MPAQCVYVFRMSVTLIGGNFPKQRWPIGVGNRDVVCFPWGVNGIFHN
jgi:hypothetical protein